MAFEAPISHLGMYVLMHAQADECTEAVVDALFVKTKGWKLSK